MCLRAARCARGKEYLNNVVTFTEAEYKRLGFKPDELTEEQLERQRSVPVEIMRVACEDLFGPRSQSHLANRIQREYPAVYRTKKLEAISKGLIVDRTLTSRIERLSNN